MTTAGCGEDGWTTSLRTAPDLFTEKRDLRNARFRPFRKIGESFASQTFKVPFMGATSPAKHTNYASTG
jgi:hypothetical protein